MRLLWGRLYLYSTLYLFKELTHIGGEVIECSLNSKNNVGELSVPHPKETAEVASKTMLSGIPKIERKIRKL
jgi:hypothetical protein